LKSLYSLTEPGLNLYVGGNEIGPSARWCSVRPARCSWRSWSCERSDEKVEGSEGESDWIECVRRCRGSFLGAVSEMR